jgi:osmotically-inducible protein OsmY
MNVPRVRIHKIAWNGSDGEVWYTDTGGAEDLCLAVHVERALCATGYGSLRGIAVTVHARLVILGGRVPSYYLKQLAQTTSLAVPGVRQVRNDLDVSRLS